MEVLLHAHSGVRAVDNEPFGVIEVHAEPLGGVVVLARKRVDEALVTLE